MASSITWVSNRMGEIGTGASFSRSDLVEGTHVIVAIARDAARHTPLASIVLRVGPEVRTIADGPALRAPVVAVAADGSPIGRLVRVRHRDGGRAPGRRRLDAGRRLGGLPGRPARPRDRRRRHGASRDRARLDAAGRVRGQRDPGRGRRRGRLDDGAGRRGLRRRCRRLRRRRGAGLGGRFGRSLARGLGAQRGRRQRQPARAVARDRARGRHVDLGPGARAVVGPARRPTSRSARTTPSTSRSSAPTRATRASTTPRTRPARGWSPRSSRSPPMPGWPARGSRSRPRRRRRRRVGRTRRRVRRDAQRRHLGRAGRGLAGCGRVGGPRAPGRRPAPRVRPPERRPAERASRMPRLIGGGAWTVDEVDDGADADAAPRGRRRRPPPRRLPPGLPRAAGPLRDRTPGGSWDDQVVTRSWTWVDPAFAVDARGHHHVAVGRIGTEPGLWYGTDAGGAWSMERVTTTPADGSVGLVVAPDGDGVIAYGEAIESEENQVAERSAWLATGTPGDWTLTQRRRRGRRGHPRDRARGGRLAAPRVRRRRGRRAADRLRHERERRLGRRADRRPARPSTADAEPVDRPRRGRSRPHRVRDGLGSRPIGPRSCTRPTAPAPGCVTQRTTGAPHDLGPRIAVDAAGQPADRVPARGLGVRLQAFNGSSWTSKTVSSGADDADPSIAIDAAGHTHVLFAAGGTPLRGLRPAAVLGAPGPPLVERRARRGSRPAG